MLWSLYSPSTRIPHPPLISRSDAEEQSLEAALAAALSHTIAEAATPRLLACLPSRARQSLAITIILLCVNIMTTKSRRTAST